MIYLDNAATTQPDKEVLDAMMPYLSIEYGNPGATYPFGRYAARAVETARGQVARLIGADPSQIIFTSGGTEANNLALFGSKDIMLSNGKSVIITDKSEHVSVLKTIETMCVKHRFDVKYLPLNEDGTVNYSGLSAMSGPEVGLVSVIYVNNETGAENDVAEIAAICRAKGILFHTDCVQAAGGSEIDVRRIGCDMLSLSAHKLHGVKGAGALYVRDKSLLSPLICGGASQESGLRGGTANVPAIVAFGAACELTANSRRETDIHCSTLRQVFYTNLVECLREAGIEDCVHINGQSIVHHGKILSLRFDGVDSETLLLILGTNGVCVSSGAACHALEQEPSVGLVSMGLTPEQARNSIRVSFAKDNTEDEAVAAAKLVASCVRLFKQK